MGDKFWSYVGGATLCLMLGYVAYLFVSVVFMGEAGTCPSWCR